MSDSFERSDTTRTQTLSVSEKRVLEGFVEAIQTAIENSETALTYVHAVGNDNIEEAELLFEQLAAIAMNGLGVCTHRRAEILHGSENMLPDNEESSGEVVIGDYPEGEPSPLLLSLDDSARFLNVSRDEIVSLMDAGEFTAEFVGSELRLNMADLDAYLQRQGASRKDTPIAGVTSAPGLSEVDDDFESIVARLFDE